LSRHKRSCDYKKPADITHVEKINELEKQLANIQELLMKNQIVPTNSGNVGNDNKNNIVGNTMTANNINNIIDNSTKSIDNSKTVNVVTYLNNNYTEAQPIKMLDSKDVTKLLSYAELGKHSLGTIIVFQHSKHVLDQLLGECILKEFKKEDPKTQQIWISDMTRLKFFVRSALNKDQYVWHSDKKGVVLTKKIITPILENVKSLMEDFVDLCKKNIEDGQLDEMLDQSENAIKVVYEINQKILHQKILRYIAPYFQLELDN
jgi:hypothetical protein